MKITKKNLSIQLSRLRQFNKPKNYLEQYATDPYVASDVLWSAMMDGFVIDRKILDAGAGYGVFSFGSLYLGCKFVEAVEIDQDQREVLEFNLKDFTNFHITIDNIANIRERFDTVFCNPPFGAVKRDADIPFLNSIFNSGERVYLLHNSINEKFLDQFIGERGKILYKRKLNMEIPRMYAHHVEDKKYLDLILYSVETKR